MRLVLAVFVGLSLVGCKSPNSTSGNETKNEVPGAAEALQTMGEKLSFVLPLSLDAEGFNNVANRDPLNQALSDLSNFRHDNKSLKKHQGDDPALQFTRDEFNEQFAEARRQLNEGNRSYSRFLIRTAAASCVSCHAERARGPNFLGNPTGLAYKNLNEIDKANYLFAIGADERAMKIYLGAIEKPTPANYGSLEAASLKALASAVRVKKDPELAARINNQYIANAKWAPETLRESAKIWTRSITTWAETPKSIAPSDTDAKSLLAAAAKKNTLSPLARAGLIETLRASAELQTLLQLPVKAKTYPDLLYMKGEASSSLHDIEPFSLSDTYYEACVNYAPHTKAATNCYLKYEGSVLATMRDLDARPLPDRLRSQLQALRRSAEPNDSPILEWGQQHD